MEHILAGKKAWGPSCEASHQRPTQPARQYPPGERLAIFRKLGSRTLLHRQHIKSTVLAEIANRPFGEPTQMRCVENPRFPVVEPPEQQAEPHRPMRNVRHRKENNAARLERIKGEPQELA